jgi:hypothetical protein
MRSGAGVPPAVARAFCPRDLAGGTAAAHGCRAQHRPHSGTRLWIQMSAYFDSVGGVSVKVTSRSSRIPINEPAAKEACLP